ncbi:ORF104 [White spot syndrome virus]|uniref:Wsv031 n=3 Tax=White spot syndrome virus TaxID=342409 RepID=Q8VBD4_WSSVS|nr:wsv031 [Shrimp white spot syndrome virus]AFX59408.1 wsv031 [White spot syndrome virus]AAL33035.1 wsv031 [Shrimp white spot syndrome virus]AAL88956.1 WSSV088 [Shrimp white spot syndrome virus]ATU84161.1 ORF104 [White spot syndrome virus]AWQ60221.1 WSV031 [Shrimp white spot syndrome virus]
MCIARTITSVKIPFSNVKPSTNATPPLFVLIIIFEKCSIKCTFVILAVTICTIFPIVFRTNP